MIQDLPQHLSTWEQWGPMGIIVGLQIGALSVIGRWLIASKDRQEAQLMQALKDAQAVSTQNAAINAQTAAILSQLSATVSKTDSRVTEVEQGLESGVQQSMGAHSKTHEILERIESQIEDRPPRSGRAPLASLFILIASAIGVPAAWDHTMNPEVRTARWVEGNVQHELATRRRLWETPSQQRERLVQAFLEE